MAQFSLTDLLAQLDTRGQPEARAVAEVIRAAVANLGTEDAPNALSYAGESVNVLVDIAAQVRNALREMLEGEG